MNSIYKALLVPGTIYSSVILLAKNKQKIDCNLRDNV